MSEISDLASYFKMQFDQLDHICKSPSPLIFLCLAAFVDYLSKIPDTRPRSSQHYSNFIIHRYPAKYRKFKYQSGMRDLPDQIYLILRNGLVHSFSLTPDSKGLRQGARFRSVYLAHRASGLKHLGHYADPKRGIDAAILIAEDFLQDTKVVVTKMIRRAKRDRALRRQIINFIKANPPVSGTDQGYFWL